MISGSSRRFRNVAVVMGGPSTERDVSLRSGAAVAAGLREAGYVVAEVDVKDRDVDVPGATEAVFVALHGEFGEDGEVQSVLEGKGIPYTGSGPRASWLSFNKSASKKTFDKKGIPSPVYEILCRGERRSLALPVVIKPPCQGSSIGVHRVLNEADWSAAAEDAFKYGPEIIVEAFVPGRELTVGIVGHEALPVVEIRAHDDWYDYKAKYTKGQTEYLVPAPLDEATARRCREIALRTFDALGCRDMGRVDIRMSQRGELLVLELNNIPGFTETSLLPKAAACAGIPFADLCARLMEMAGLERSVAGTVVCCGTGT